MDRNLWWGVRKAVGSLSLSARRAWIEIDWASVISAMTGSLSARRAWIEIGLDFAEDWLDAGSLSARRAWIEISAGVDFAEDWLVALRKESVDRNHAPKYHRILLRRRSPQGERG